MQIHITQEDNLVVFALSGELDHHSAPRMKEQVDGYLTSTNIKNYLFDFTDLSFMDSSGIGAIIGRYKNIQALSGRLCIVCKKPQIVKILTMAGINKIIPVYETMEYARRKWGEPA